MTGQGRIPTVMPAQAPPVAARARPTLPGLDPWAAVLAAAEAIDSGRAHAARVQEEVLARVRQVLEEHAHRGVLLRWDNEGSSWLVESNAYIKPGTVVVFREQAHAAWQAQHWPTF